MLYGIIIIGSILLSLFTARVVSKKASREKEQYLEEAKVLRQQEQTALMNNLAGGVAHEFRNPLSTLSMNLQLLREEWENPITEREVRSRKKMDVLLREVERLERSLTGFLKLAAGHELHLNPINLNELMKEMIETFSPQADNSGITLRHHLKSPAPYIQGDSDLLRGAILNLMVNAQQAMPEGGEMEFHLEKNGNQALLHIHDTGVGIPKEDVGKVFTMYYSTKPGGTGLGLPIAARIIQEHGGSIEVSPRNTGGTTVTVSLPL